MSFLQDNGNIFDKIVGGMDNLFDGSPDWLRNTLFLPGNSTENSFEKELGLGEYAPEPQVIEATPLEKELQAIAEEDWADYQTNFQPLEGQFINQVEGYNTEDARDRMVGDAVLGARQDQPQYTAGGAPTLASLTDHYRSNSGSTATAAMAGNLAANNRYYAGLSDIASIGRNVAGGATQDLTKSAALEAAENKYKVGLENDLAISNAQGLGEIAGTVAGRYWG